MPRSRMCVAIPPLLQYALTAWCSVKSRGTTLSLPLALYLAESVAFVGYCSATGVCIPLILIFKEQVVWSPISRICRLSKLYEWQRPVILISCFSGMIAEFSKASHFWQVPAHIRWTHVSFPSGGFELLSTAL